MYKYYHYISREDNAIEIKTYAMMQNQELTIIQRNSLKSEKFSAYSEKKHNIKTKSGGAFFFHETTFDSLQFIQCNYTLIKEEQLQINIEKEALEMHFRLDGSSGAYRSGQPLNLIKGSNTISYLEDYRQDIVMSQTETGSFLEIRIGQSHFEKLLSDFASDTSNLFSGTVMTTTPAMRNTIAQIQINPYNQKMRGLYMEAKMTELFLLQLQKSNNHPLQKSLSFGKMDRDKLFHAKQLIEQHMDQFLTITQLAQLIGMNKRKLMLGFKELFGMTVYSYIKDLKMEEAKRLLLEEDKYVNEVADHIGYQNPQHFITAFKKKFGISPGTLKQ